MIFKEAMNMEMCTLHYEGEKLTDRRDRMERE